MREGVIGEELHWLLFCCCDKVPQSQVMRSRKALLGFMVWSIAPEVQPRRLRGHISIHVQEAGRANWKCYNFSDPAPSNMLLLSRLHSQPWNSSLQRDVFHRVGAGNAGPLPKQLLTQ